MLWIVTDLNILTELETKLLLILIIINLKMLKAKKNLTVSNLSVPYRVQLP